MGKREGLIEWLRTDDDGWEGGDPAWAEKMVDDVIAEALREAVAARRGLRYSAAHAEEWMGYDHQEDAWSCGYQDALDSIDPDVTPEFLQPGFRSSAVTAADFFASLDPEDRP